MKYYNSPLSRALKVFETIGANGPIKLVDLVSKLPISKTALHRICSELEKEGWVKKRVADKAYYASNTIEEVFSTATFAPYLLEKVHPVLQDAKKEEIYHVVISAFTTLTKLSVIDGTQNPNHWDEDLSSVFAPSFASALSVMSVDERLKLLKKYLSSASAEAADEIRSGNLSKRVAEISVQGYSFDLSMVSLHIPLNLPLCGVVVISLEPVSATKISAKHFKADASSIAATYKAKVLSCFDPDEA